jgi:hypothetical protein
MFGAEPGNGKGMCLPLEGKADTTAANAEALRRG